jgi:hypothetical protein
VDGRPDAQEQLRAANETGRSQRSEQQRGVGEMKKLDTIHSVTRKPLGEIYDVGAGLFAFSHLVADEFQGGFETWNDAYEAFIKFHNNWQEKEVRV